MANGVQSTGGSSGSGGGGGGGGAATIADGADVTEGAIADAAVAAGAAGTISAKLRRLTTDTDAIKTSVAAATPAGENHIGSVGGNTAIVTSTVVMSAAGAYATGDYMGTTTTPQAFTSAVRVSGGTGIIKSVFISDKITTANVAMELWLFSATFGAPTDNAAWAISDAEALTVLGVIPIAVANWYASANNQVYSDNTLSIPIKPAATSLFYALVARGTTPAFTSSDLTIGLGILQD